MKASKTLLILTVLSAVTALVSCTGRRADTMVPLGETVEVVIPDGDVAADSAIAAGNTTGDSVVADAADI